MKKVKTIFRPNEIKTVIDKTGVYAISFGNKNKFYIGSAAAIASSIKSGRGFYNRWQKHLIMLRKGTHYSPRLQNVYIKYGEKNMKFHILKICKNTSCLKYEQEFIDKYKSYEDGYNCRPLASNNGGIKWSSVRKRNYEEKFKKIRTKILSQILKLYNKNKSTREIAKILHISRTLIIRIFKENNIKTKTVGQTRRKAINQYDLNGNFIKKWESKHACSNGLNIHKNSISLVLKGICKQGHGFYFEYA
jgi:group I intron endonuclease